MLNHLIDEAKRSEILSKELIDRLFESMEYSSISFINWSIDVLKIIKIRIERGDKIIDEVSGVTYDMPTFQAFIEKHFSSYIASEVFAESKKPEKVYFQLEKAEDGFNLVMASSSKEKVYRWISSLNERFSLVEMIATGIVYIKDIAANSYSPFISDNGKYCKYDPDLGKIVEIN